MTAQDRNSRCASDATPGAALPPDADDDSPSTHPLQP
jgi:hypothetical protein